MSPPGLTSLVLASREMGNSSVGQGDLRLLEHGARFSGQRAGSRSRRHQGVRPGPETWFEIAVSLNDTPQCIPSGLHSHRTNITGVEGRSLSSLHLLDLSTPSPNLGQEKTDQEGKPPVYPEIGEGWIEIKAITEESRGVNAPSALRCGLHRWL